MRIDHIIMGHGNIECEMRRIKTTGGRVHINVFERDDTTGEMRALYHANVTHENTNANRVTIAIDVYNFMHGDHFPREGMTIDNFDSPAWGTIVEIATHIERLQNEF